MGVQLAFDAVGWKIIFRARAIVSILHSLCHQQTGGLGEEPGKPTKREGNDHHGREAATTR